MWQSNTLQAGTLRCRDGEEEVLESYLSEQAPELKISLSLLAGGVISSGALALCWLTGSDPWGKLLIGPVLGSAPDLCGLCFHFCIHFLRVSVSASCLCTMEALTSHTVYNNALCRPRKGRSVNRTHLEQLLVLS